MKIMNGKQIGGEHLVDRKRRELIKCAGMCVLAGVATATPVASVRAKSLPAGADAGEFARKRFLSHWNCTQAVLEATSHLYKGDPEMAVRMATGFAGGMTTGKTCGALTGAYMAIGLIHGGEGVPSKKVAGAIARLNSDFIEKFGATGCSPLVGTDMATAEGVKQAGKKKMFTQLCPKLVEMAVKGVEELA